MRHQVREQMFGDDYWIETDAGRLPRDAVFLLDCRRDHLATARVVEVVQPGG